MNRLTDEFSLAKQKLAKDIVGEIVMTENSEKVIKKWRDIFKISQKSLANELEITPSVISDYESGRRRSPGIKMVGRYVTALLKIDEDGGGNIIRTFSKTNNNEPIISNAIMDIKEFSAAMSIQEFLRRVNATPVVRNGMDKPIYGYTVIDSHRAITELSFNELVKLYGITSQRALIFTKVSTGKTPMVAIKLTNLHPTLVVLHGLDVVDEVARRIAEVEGIPLAISRMAKPEDILEGLKNLD
ncbi:MAG: helix-turn-helix domain-containing protein [Candidatus Aenigmarchaeota archaeon]|nr:helix-turn-helix domain-containing protein [Candidatus Aenigmarchaeota archaeon]